MATNKTRIKIRHGSGKPDTGTDGLLPYELGWDGTNLALYINNNGTIKKVGGEGLFLPLTGGTLSGPVINNFNNSSVGRHLTDLCHSYLGSSATGTIKITLPNTTSNMVMMVIRIILYTYNSDSGKELIISGYTYNNSTWYNYQATVLGGKMAQTIRLAYDGTHYCILLGATDTVWPFTSVQLADVYSSYGAQPTSGYSISLITSESGYTVTATVGHALVIGNGGTGAMNAAGARANLGTWSLVSDSYNTFMPADGTTNGWYKFGTSNTSYGILPSASGGAGSGHNYIGTSSWYWKYAYIDEIHGTLNGNATTASGISTSGGSAAKFWRGDNTWSNTISGGTLKITANSNTLTIGSQNANCCHIYNSANIPFIFNNTVATTTGNLGNATYPWNNLYIGAANGAGIYYKGTKNTYRMIRFIDNTSDIYGNGISIGGGGQTIIGGGESADTAAAQAGTAGAEIMQVCNDGDVQIISNLQNGWDNRKTFTMNATGQFISAVNCLSTSTNSSWLTGQYSTNAAYNVGNANDTGSYWPWMRQTNTSSSKWFSFGTLSTKFYWIGSATSRTENGYDSGMSFDVANGYLQGCSRVYGAVWNDYAEYRKDNPKENQEPGRCIRELGDGSLALTTKRLERGCEIVSDTFGFAIGQDEENGYNTPIASNGRVLAYPYESIKEFASHIGWPVCSGPNGTVSIMTEEEEEKYPSRIVGTISEIPDYEEWGTGKVKVDGRIWIKVH